MTGSQETCPPCLALPCLLLLSVLLSTPPLNCNCTQICQEIHSIELSAIYMNQRFRLRCDVVLFLRGLYSTESSLFFSPHLTHLNLQSDIPEGVIRVHAPLHSKVSMAIQLNNQTKTKDILARFYFENR